MLIAVTGSTGHVGACLVRQLVGAGHQVRALVRDASPPSLSGVEVERVIGDVRNAAQMRTFVDGAELVYHLAAVISIVGPKGGLVEAVNVGGVRNVGRAVLDAGVPRMVHVCSVHAFEQEPLDQAIDETRTRVRDGLAPAYDVSKARGETEIRTLVDEGLDAVIVHPSGIIGPYDFGPSRMGQVFLDLFHRRLPSLVDGGFDFVDVRDVCAGIQAAAVRGRTNESYLLTGRYQRIVDLATIAHQVTGVRPPRFQSPMWLAQLGAPVMEAVAKLRGAQPLYTSESLLALRANKAYTLTKSIEELGYTRRPTIDSVRDLYTWFARHGRLERAPKDLESIAAQPVSLE